MAVTFYPEPCEQCNHGHACVVQGPIETWPDSWLTPSERKGQTVTKL